MKIRGVIPVAVLAMMLALSGCAVLVVGGVATGGAVVYLNKVEGTVQAPVPETQSAAREALAGFGLDVIEDAHDMETGRLKSRYADGKPVWVSLEAIGPTVTEVTVRVGVVAETARARKIMSAIRSNISEQGGEEVARSSELEEP